MLRNAMLTTVACAIVCLPGLAAEKAKDAPVPAAEPAKAAPLKATVVSVSGVAQRLSAGGAAGQWQPLKAGDVLDELTIIRTGLGAKVELNLSDRGQVTISSATKIGIGELSKSDQTVKARLGLKYGAVRAQVDNTRGPNDFQVATPVATLSVRGSGGGLAFWADLGLMMCCTDGSLQLSVGGKKRRVHPAECTDHRLQQSIALTQARGDTQMGDPSGGTTPAEQANLNANGGGRGVFSFAGMGGTLPTGDACRYVADGNDQDQPTGYPPDYPGEHPPDYPPFTPPVLPAAGPTDQAK